MDGVWAGSDGQPGTNNKIKTLSPAPLPLRKMLRAPAARMEMLLISKASLIKRKKIKEKKEEKKKKSEAKKQKKGKPAPFY